MTWAEAVARLAEVLRAQGILVSVQHCVQASRVLEELEARGDLRSDADELAAYLGPIFCTHPQQQERFPEFVRAWLGLIDERRDGPEKAGESSTRAPAAGGSPSPEDDQPRTPGWRTWIRSRGGWVLAGVILVALVGWVLVSYWPRPKPERDLPGTVVSDDDGVGVAGAEVRWAGRVTRADEAGRFAFRGLWPQPGVLTVIATNHEPATLSGTNLAWPVTVRLRRLAAVTEPGTNAAANEDKFQPKIIRPETFARDGPLAEWELLPPLVHRPSAWVLPWIAPLAWLGLVIWRARHRQQAVLRRESSGTPARTGSFPVPVASREGVTGLPARELARDLRRRRRVASGQLDATRTIEAAVRHPGVYAPVFGSWAESEYLVLVDRGSRSDQQACWVEDALRTLRDSGVGMEVLSFDRDPTWCQPSPVPGRMHLEGRVRLDELAVRFAEHRVLLFTDGGGFFDAYSGQVAGWVRTLEAWPERAWVTPKPVSRWGQREWWIERTGLTVLPMTRDGFRLLGDLFRDRPPSRLAPSDRGAEDAKAFAVAEWRWLDRHAPGEAAVDELYWSLAWDLGPVGLRWLAACAVYPELHWGLTQQIGEALVSNVSEREALLARLVRLVWFRRGAMPDWLRRTLLARMDERDQDRVRQIVLKILDAAGLNAGSDAVRSREEARVALPSGAGAEGATKTRWWAARLRAVGRWLRRRRQALEREQRPADDPLRDWVYLRFVAGDRVDLLTPTVSERLRRALYPEGRARWGLRWQAATGIASALIGVALFAWYPAKERRRPGACVALGFAGTNDTVAALYVDGSVAVWPALDPGDPATSEGRWLDVDGPVRAMALAEVGGQPMLALGGTAGRVLVGPATWARAWKLSSVPSQGIDAEVTALAFEVIDETNAVVVGHANGMLSVGTLGVGHASRAAGYEKLNSGRMDSRSRTPIRGLVSGSDGHVLAVNGNGFFGDLSPDLVRQSEEWPDDQVDAVIKREPLAASTSFLAREPRRLAVGRSDGEIRIFGENPDSNVSLEGAPLFVLQRHAATVLAVAYDPNGGYVSSSGLDGQVLAWEIGDANDGYGVVSRLARPDGTGRYHGALAFARDGRRLMAGASDGGIRIFLVPPARPAGRAQRTADGAEQVDRRDRKAAD